ncbi:MAG: MFS transporter [Chloroflexi bacterium]|nr:MFS transporter [Chloroflexota bacterium]
MKPLRPFDLLAINLYWFSLSFFLNGLGRFIQPVLVAALVAPEIKNTALGVLTASGLVVATVVQPLMGAVSDHSTLRWGRRRPFILAGTLLDFGFLVLIGLSGNYLLLFVAILLVQFSTNTAHGALQGLIPDLVPPSQRGKAVGVKQFLEFAGLILTSIITARFLDQAQGFFERGQPAQALGPIFTALGIIIALLAVGLVPTLLWVRERPLGASSENRARPRISDVLRVDVRANGDYFWLLAGRVFILVGLSVITTFAIYFFSDVVRLPNPVAVTGNLIVTAGLLTLLVTYPAGYLTDRLGRKPLNLIAGPLAAAAALGLLTVTNRTLFQLGPLAVTDILAYATLLGLASGVFLSANWTWATDLIPPAEAGKYLGLANLANAGSGVLSGFVGGPIIDFFNAQGPGLGYNVAFLLAAASFLLGTLLMARVRETRTRPALVPEGV